MIAASPLSLWEALLLGLVEGITEYLPVSSTGHLLLVAKWLGRGDDAAINSYVIVIQAGAILAVLGLYHARIVQMLRGISGRDRAGLRLFCNLLLAFLPVAILGLTFRNAIKAHLYGMVPIAIALAIGGLVIFAFEPRGRRLRATGRGVEEITPRQALAIGCAQCFALWPGTSRSLATILGGLGAGLSPAAAAEFSFLLALPTLGAATLYEAVKEGGTLMVGVPAGPLVLGLLVSFVTAALAVRTLVAWLGRHGFWQFGVYRIVLAATVLITIALA